MNRNFFIRLVFATHKVADALPDDEEVKQEIKDAANVLLTDLILFSEREVVSGEMKRSLIPKLVKEIEVLISCLNRGKREGWINPKNFLVLEEEYGRIQELLQIFDEVEEIPSKPKKEDQSVVKKVKQEGKEETRKTEDDDLSERQKKILGFLKAKENAQVWEIQKMLPEVTKRTLRRDLDDLLQMNLVQRKGEWNSVFYELR